MGQPFSPPTPNPYSNESGSIENNWGAVLAEKWSDGEIDSIAPPTPRGFPNDVPVKIEQPDFTWIQRGARSAQERRQDYERSIPRLTSIIDKRRPGFDKGRDIEQDVYLRRQDEEIRKSSRSLGLI